MSLNCRSSLCESFSRWPSSLAALPAVTKKRSLFRLLAQRELRLKLARFTDNPEELAISYKRESLRHMCREADIWRSGNKRALSAGLLNWRDRCRARGQAFLAEMRLRAKGARVYRRHTSDFASYTWQLQRGRRILVGLSRIAHDRPASSTASVAANKNEIFSLACVKLKVNSLNPHNRRKMRQQ
jgi:hypothetical protein